MNSSLLNCLNCSKDSKPKFDPPFDYLKIIKLETTPDCLIDGLAKLEILDSLIFYFDSRDELYIFNIEGKFITKVGQKGQGPQDYARINTFFIHHNNVVLVDAVKGSLLYYDFRGKFISSMSIPREYLRNIISAQLFDEEKLLICYMISWRADENTSYSVLNLSTKTIEWLDFTYNPIKLDNYYHYFSFNQMVKVQDEIHFIMPLCDTIFSYSESSIYPKYITKTHDKIAKKEQIEYNTHTLHLELLKLEEQGYFVGFKAIFETENIIILEYGTILGFYMFDKNTKQGYFHHYAFDEVLKEVPFFIIRRSLSNDQFVAVEPMERLISLMDFIDGDDKYLMQLKKIIENSEEDDNPILFIYGFNK